MANDYRILASPRISRSTFAIALKQGGSPAAPYANDCYGAIAGHGVDPALGLAVFQHESSMGGAGVASRTKSWGNLRDPATGTFKSYSSWRAGADDMARLLAVYGHNAIRKGTVTATARTFPFVWAPAADNNAPAAYGSAIVASINRFRAIEGKGPAYDATYSGPTSSSGSGSKPPATKPPSSDGGVVLSIINATATSSCKQVTIIDFSGNFGIGPFGGSLGLYPIPRDLIGQPCVECKPGFVPAIISVGPVQTIQGFTSPEAVPGLANACVRAGTKEGDRPTSGPTVDDIGGAIAGLPGALGAVAGGLLVNVVVIGAVLGLGWAGIRRILSSSASD